MPPIEETSAPSTKPACTPLDNSAWRSGEMAASRAMSGSTAAEANHRLMPAISATTSNDTDRFFDGLAPGMSAFLPLRTRLRAGQATGNGAGACRRRLCRNWRRCRLQSGCTSAALTAWRAVARAFMQRRRGGLLLWRRSSVISPRMNFIPPAVRGPLFMVIATGSYVINDTMMKLATVGLPSYEVLFLRGVAAAHLGLSAGAAARLRPPAGAYRRPAGAVAQSVRARRHPLPMWWRWPTCRSPTP